MVLAAGQIAQITDVAPNVNGISSPCDIGNTTTTEWANIPGSTSFSFEKLRDESKLRVDMHLTAYVTTSQATIEIGVQIGGVDYLIGRLLFNPLATHLQISGSHPGVADGLAAGIYPVSGRWRRASGTGTGSVDSGDWLSIVMQEV